MISIPFTDQKALRELQTALELSTLSDLNTRAAALANRWVKALNPGDTFDYYSASNVVIDPDAKLISFHERCKDGVSFMGRQSISTRYLDDASSLESDAKTWKAAENQRLADVRARIEELKARPEVIEYLSLATHSSQSWAHPQGYGWHGIPLYPTHDLLKETPKP